jgi:hypothetical protein
MAQAPSADDAVVRVREACLQRAWQDAYQHLSAADREEPLAAEDLDRLATAAYLIGRLDAADAAWERTHHAFLVRGDTAPAVRCGFWLGLTLFLRGEQARGSGWMARAQHLLEAGALDCVEQGYVRIPMALHALGGGDAESAYRSFVEITEIRAAGRGAGTGAGAGSHG